MIVVTTDNESREFKVIQNMEEGHPPEHPRDSTTDDVECIFSVLRDLVGKNFTVSKVQYEWKKVWQEFQKSINPELPFCYHTSSHDRFCEGPRPSFDVSSQSPGRNPRHQRVQRREQLGLLAPGRVTLPTPGAQSTRTVFHNVPVELPPPPGTVSMDHSYGQQG